MGSEVEALKAVFSSSTNLAQWATLAVFVGLVVDIAVILIFDLFDKDKSWWEIILAGIASLIIAAGVWGEWHFGDIATKASLQLQAMSEEKVAALKHDNLQLEKLLLPRHIATDSMGRAFKTVSQFAGIDAEIFTVPDLEAERLAAEIRSLLDACNWSGKGSVTVLSLESSLIVPDGVNIFFSMTLKAGKRGLEPDFSTPQSKAANALSEYLEHGYLEDMSSPSAEGIESRAEVFLAGSTAPKNSRPRWWPSDFTPPSDTICIFVGMKPITSGVANLDWLNHLPDKIRKRFERQDQPFIIPRGP